MDKTERPPRSLTCPKCNHKWFPVVVHQDTRCPLESCQSYVFKDDQDIVWAKHFLGLN